MRLLIPIADALDTAHAAGLIHRDIKPQNILVDELDHSYLADFGLMKARTEASLTEPGHFIGTCDYVCPEQICGGRAGKQSDLYSLAAVLYECLSGVAPYPKDSEVAVLYAHVHDPPPRITAVRPELPANLDEVIGRGMAKAPEDRHGSAAELMSEVERTLAGDVTAIYPKAILAPVNHGPFAGSADPTTPLVASPVKRRTLRPRPAVLAAAVLTILTAAGFLAGRAVSERAPTAPVSAGAERDYAGAMKQTIRALNRARRAGRSKLAAARTPAAQANAASALAGSHRTGARTVAGLAAGPSAQPAQPVIADALTRAASGYTTMASAARQGTSHRYDRGRNTVRGSERVLRLELERLADNGLAPR
jgi:serine/threonine-protein kinase